MSFRFSFVKIVGIALFLSGCAFGEPFDLAIKSLPALSPEKGRIFVYRNRNVLGMAFPRTVVLDGKPTANTYTGTSLFIDTAPGDHAVTTKSQGYTLKFTVIAGESVYLRFSIVDDTVVKGNTIIETVPARQALMEMSDTSLIEAKTKTATTP